MAPYPQAQGGRVALEGEEVGAAGNLRLGRGVDGTIPAAPIGPGWLRRRGERGGGGSRVFGGGRGLAAPRTAAAPAGGCKRTSNNPLPSFQRAHLKASRRRERRDLLSQQLKRGQGRSGGQHAGAPKPPAGDGARSGARRRAGPQVCSQPHSKSCCRRHAGLPASLARVLAYCPATAGRRPALYARTRACSR